MYPVAGVMLILALGACGGSTTEEGASTPTASATSPAAPESPAAAEEDCRLAQVDGTTTNAELQALATEVYSSLQCGAGQALSDQLKAQAEDTDVKAQADAAGLEITVGDAAGGTVMQMVSVKDRSACTVTVLDSADAKSLTCADL